ncbi:MAG TPA: hypothetical protein VHR45_19400 [Thermoanaerobaculia bacterium]|nr:hypothetical protein [Thermoanaerobaculia bacterium]
MKVRSPQVHALTPGSLAAVVAMLLLAAAPAVSAANLLTNPGFDTGLTSWTVNGATWSPSDALGLAGSGSASGTNTASGSFTFVNVLTSACISVSAGQFYAASLDYLLPSGQTQTPEAEVQASWYGPGGCTGGSFIASNVLVEGTAADGQWHRLGSSSSSAATAPPGAQFVLVELSVVKLKAGGSAVAFFDNAVFRTRFSCAELPDVLCLKDRFEVTGSWQTGSNMGTAFAVPLTTDTGYFWFFSPANVEVVLKVLDGCSLNSHYWVFAGGLTDVQVHLRVTEAGTVAAASYVNPSGTAFQPIQDVGALAVCP